MILVAEMMDEVGFRAVETWGGVTFDTMRRFLNEDPWERLRTLSYQMITAQVKDICYGLYVIRYLKNVGDKVSKGEAVVVLEAMKMENALPAPCDGEIKAIGLKSGDTVPKGATLCIIG